MEWHETMQHLLLILALFGAGMVIGEGVLTPAIFVFSAIVGLELAMSSETHKYYKMSRRQAAQHSKTGQIVEPGRIPDPPATWYPLGSDPLASTNSTEVPRSSQDGDTVKDTLVRGPSCPTGLRGRDGGKLDIIMNNLGQPIMEAHSTLASRLGVLARDGTLAPLNYYDWRCVPDHYKTRIWDEIKANTNADESMKSFLMKSVAEKWREWKHEAKFKGFTQYTTNMLRLAH